MNRPHKFGARKVTVDGITFDSAAEARRYGELKLLQRAGEIKELVRQPTYQLFGMGSSEICKYKADFFYLTKDGTRVVEDVKSPVTAKLPVYRLKKKLLFDNYGIKIKEVF